MVLSFEGEECNHVANDDAEWVIDLKTSYHATLIKEFFTSYKSGNFGTMKMGIEATRRFLGFVIFALR